jgi:TRAP-type C4-dicarboxylate transport system permease small subunit
MASGGAERVLAVLDRAARLLAYAGGTLLLLLALLTVADVVLRWLWNAPIYGAQDLSEMGLVLVVFGSIAYCGRAGGHVAVDLFVGFFGRHFRRASDLLVRSASIAIFAVLAWQAVRRGAASTDYDVTNLIEIPRGPFYYFVGFGAGLYCAILLFEALLSVLRPNGAAPSDGGA